MIYKKGLFGKISPKKDTYGKFKNDLKHDFENNSNAYMAGRIKAFHFYVGIIFVWCIYLLLDILFGIKIKVRKGDVFMAFLVVFGFPAIFGMIKVLILDPFFDTFSYTIKWFFAIFTAILIAFLAYYTTSH